MLDRSRGTALRSRLRFRASHRIAPLRVSHRGPSTWTPPAKDDDDRSAPVNVPRKKR